VNDPDNKRRVDELSLRMDGFVSDVTTTVKGAADSEVGQSFREAADKTGEAFRQAGGKLSDELGPRLSGAFKSAAERLGQAAERMEDRARREPEPGEAPEAPTSGEADATDGV
jgi:TPR repeat protein